MTNERFNELLNGPLSHPLVAFTVTRLALALRAVVEATGIAGEKALEMHCAEREQQDQENAAYHEKYGQEEGFADEDSGLPPAFEPEDNKDEEI